MSRLNAFARGEFQRGIREGNRELVRLTTELTGANSAPVRQAAAVLARAWREQLSTPGGALRTNPRTGRVTGAPSKPGEPPHRITGKLRKSVTTAVVDGVRRVGSGLFKARLLEFGVDASVARRRSPKGRRGGRKAVAVRTGIYRLHIAPRPAASKALERAAPQMVDVFVSDLGRRVGTA